MAIERNRLVDLLKQLPEELQGEVLEFAESLLQKSRTDPSASREKGTPSIRALFGIWDSGDPRSADNDRIDADLAREYASSHEGET
jgi:hypothetical protein